MAAKLFVQMHATHLVASAFHQHGVDLLVGEAIIDEQIQPSTDGSIIEFETRFVGFRGKLHRLQRQLLAWHLADSDRCNAVVLVVVAKAWSFWRTTRCNRLFRQLLQKANSRLVILSHVRNTILRNFDSIETGKLRVSPTSRILTQVGVECR